MNQNNYRGRHFMFLLLIMLMVIALYQEPSISQSIATHSQLSEEHLAGQSFLAEMKFLKVLLSKVIHVIS